MNWWAKLLKALTPSNEAKQALDDLAAVRRAGEKVLAGQNLDREEETTLIRYRPKHPEGDEARS